MLQTVWISASIPIFMVIENCAQDFAIRYKMAEISVPQFGMTAELRNFPSVQHVSLVKDGGRKKLLTDVMQKASQIDPMGTIWVASI